MIEIWLGMEATTALDMFDLPMVEGLVPWAPPERQAPGGPGWSLAAGRELQGRATTMVQWIMSRQTAEWLVGEIDWRLECWRGPKDATGELERGTAALQRAKAALQAAMTIA